MLIDKPKLSKATRDLIRKQKNHMKLLDSETSQLEVFDELISESENRQEYNKFRKTKKQYVKDLQLKYLIQKGNK